MGQYYIRHFEISIFDRWCGVVCYFDRFKTAQIIRVKVFLNHNVYAEIGHIRYKRQANKQTTTMPSFPNLKSRSGATPPYFWAQFPPLLCSSLFPPFLNSSFLTSFGLLPFSRREVTLKILSEVCPVKNRWCLYIAK